MSGPTPISAEQRFWSHVVQGPSPSDCWIWTGAVGDDGYGRFWVPQPGGGQRAMRPQRWLYEHLTGTVLHPSTLLLHACDVPLCVHVDIASHDGVATPALAEALYDVMPDQVEMNRGAEDFVRAIHDQGKKLAIVSNTALDVRPILQRWGLESLFDAVVLSHEVGCVKPDPAIFRVAARELGVEAPDCVMVGDTPVDDSGAVAVGMQSVIAQPEQMWRAFELVLGGSRR